MRLRINEFLLVFSALILSGFSPVFAADTSNFADYKNMKSREHRMSSTDKTSMDLRHKKSDMKGMRRMPEMEEMMGAMPPDYEVFINEGTKNEVGVMVLTHGGWKVWDKKVTEAVKKYTTSSPTVICFGMAMMQSDHLQKGIDDLERSGAKKIIIVPLFVGKYNEVARHFRYLFGLAKTSFWPEIEKVHSTAKIIYQPEVNPLNPLIVEIITNYAQEMSINPQKERVLIIGHGPSGVKNNQEQERDLNSMGELIKKEMGFKEVQAKNLQDDNHSLRPKNVKAIREIIAEWSHVGDIIVLPFLMSSSRRGIQPKIRNDLKELKYKFNPKGLSEHKNFALWIKKSVDGAIVK